MNMSAISAIPPVHSTMYDAAPYAQNAIGEVKSGVGAVGSSTFEGGVGVLDDDV